MTNFGGRGLINSSNEDKILQSQHLLLGPGGHSPAVWLKRNAVRVLDRAAGADLGPRRVTGGSRGPWADRLRGVPEKRTVSHKKNASLKLWSNPTLRDPICKII